MLNQGLLLLATGMGTVFVFLVLMVLVMQAVGLFFKANEERFREAAPAAAPRKAAADDENERVAAVVAAINAHLRK